MLLSLFNANPTSIKKSRSARTSPIYKTWILTLQFISHKFFCLNFGDLCILALNVCISCWASNLISLISLTFSLTIYLAIRTLPSKECLDPVVSDQVIRNINIIFFWGVFRLFYHVAHVMMLCLCAFICHQYILIIADSVRSRVHSHISYDSSHSIGKKTNPYSFFVSSSLLKNSTDPSKLSPMKSRKYLVSEAQNIDNLIMI